MFHLNQFNPEVALIFLQEISLDKLKKKQSVGQFHNMTEKADFI